MTERKAMTHREHRYPVEMEWTGNLGTGTSGYRDYGRNHELLAGGRPNIPASSDPTFRGDEARWNPEQLLVASLSSCHMLWYLHLCAEGGVVVTHYRDLAEGTMVESSDGGGRFASVTLRPKVVISAGSSALAASLHHAAHEKCFIANSVNFPVHCEPTITGP
jgi:organic hydroperoxide reductase OsmC/OhrA